MPDLSLCIPRVADSNSYFLPSRFPVYRSTRRCCSRFPDLPLAELRRATFAFLVVFFPALKLRWDYRTWVLDRPGGEVFGVEERTFLYLNVVLLRLLTPHFGNKVPVVLTPEPVRVFSPQSDARRIFPCMLASVPP